MNISPQYKLKISILDQWITSQECIKFTMTLVLVECFPLTQAQRAPHLSRHKQLGCSDSSRSFLSTPTPTLAPSGHPTTHFHVCPQLNRGQTWTFPAQHRQKIWVNSKTILAYWKYLNYDNQYIIIFLQNSKALNFILSTNAVKIQP